jgi:hypothetical protein
LNDPKNKQANECSGDSAKHNPQDHERD